jgi:acyl carrier protein
MQASPTDEATSLTQIVMAIWASELNAADISTGSDFFEQGGDSLRMLSMLFKIADRTGIEVLPAVLFENPTLGEFCRAVESQRAGSSAPDFDYDEVEI